MGLLRRQSSTGSGAASSRSNLNATNADDSATWYAVEANIGGGRDSSSSSKKYNDILYDPELNTKDQYGKVSAFRPRDFPLKLPSKPTKSVSTSSLSSKENTSSSSFFRSPAFWRAFTFIQYLAFCVASYFAFNTNKTLAHQLEIMTEVSDLVDALNDKLFMKEEELYETHEDFMHLNLKLNAFTPAIERKEIYDEESRKELMSTFIQRNDAQADRIIALENAIQKFDERELKRRYGEGPYNIEVSVIIQGIRKYFTIKTAPPNIAPHGIKTFMDMIENKVWNDTVLYHQAEHVVVGVPINMKGERKSAEIAKPVQFSEYSSEYPHNKFTVGLQGHPGGPEFYINMQNNDEIHGPGGQEYHDVTDNGDTCFGEITHGRDVLNLFAELNRKALQTKNGVFYTLIESMTVIPNMNKKK